MKSDDDILLPGRDDLEQLSALCLRSKAHWGYDAAFMAACETELTLTADDLDAGGLAMVRVAGEPAGLVQVMIEDGEAELHKLFVDPRFMGRGLGARLMDWARQEARARGARRMKIAADPDAVPFYRRMGAVPVGEVPSESIPGRSLPLLALDLPGDPAVD